MNVDKILNIFEAFHISVNVSPVELHLPIVFHKKYEFMQLLINGEKFLLMKEKRTGSLENFVKQAKGIQKQTGLVVVLVFNKLSGIQKKQLLQIAVPYLDYHENIYFPYLGFLFSKVENKVEVDKKLSSTEQKVLISLLLNSSTREINIEEISCLTDLSIPSLYRVFKNFKDRGWLTNKNKSYHFAKTKAQIFNEAKKFLKNPIHNTVLISEDDFQRITQNLDLKLSNTKALSIISILADNDEYGTYALSKKQFKKIEESFQQHIFQGHKIEIWDYEPIHFNYLKEECLRDESQGESALIDPISLYLILKDDEDPRIEEEVEKLESKIFTLLGEKYAS